MIKANQGKPSTGSRNGVAMDQSSSRDSRYLRLVNQRELMAPRTGAMVTATRDRIKNTRRMITQSRELLKRARMAMDSSRQLSVMDASGDGA